MEQHVYKQVQYRPVCIDTNNEQLLLQDQQERMNKIFLLCIMIVYNYNVIVATTIRMQRHIDILQENGM